MAGEGAERGSTAGCTSSMTTSAAAASTPAAAAMMIPGPPPLELHSQLTLSLAEMEIPAELDRMTSIDILLHRYDEIAFQDSMLSLLADKDEPSQDTTLVAVATPSSVNKPSSLLPAAHTLLTRGGALPAARPMLTRGGAVSSQQETYFGRSTRNLLFDYGKMLDTYADILDGK
jgi:hypothetical protein